MPRTSPIIEVTHLVKRFKDLAAVDDISFAVEAGDMLPVGAARVGFDIGVLAVVALLISMLSAWFYPKVVL